MIVEGWVEMLHCADCGATQPNWIFSADTDMMTDGLFSAGDQRGSILVLSRNSDAWDNANLRAAEFKRVGSTETGRAGLNFDEFRKLHFPSEPVFACPWCEHGEMKANRKLTSREFVAEGGRLDCQNGIVIREGS